MTRKVMAAGLLTVSLAVLAGCGGAKNAGDSSQPKPAAETSQTGQPPTGQPQPAKGGTQYQIVGAESTASYTVHEKFLDKDLSGTAVGKSSGITGTLVIDGGKLQPSTVTVDLKKLQSDKAQRDKRLQTQGLEIEKYPTAEFAITGAEGAAPTFADGQEVGFKLAGKLKLHGTEKPVVWDAKGKLQGGAFHLTGLIKFKMGEFNMEPPNVLNLISVDDNVQLDVDLTAKQG
jgi:polyisoprenoid-binding protein YceI